MDQQTINNLLTSLNIAITATTAIITIAVGIASVIVTYKTVKKYGDLPAAEWSEQRRQERDLALEQALLTQIEHAVEHALTIGKAILALGPRRPLDQPIPRLPTHPFQAILSPEYHVLARHKDLFTAASYYVSHATLVNTVIGRREHLLSAVESTSPTNLTYRTSIQSLNNQLRDLTLPVDQQAGPPTSWWDALAALQKHTKRALADVQRRTPS